MMPVVSAPVKKPYAPRLPPAERREQLLDAALGIALERGFHSVTVDGVARAAGVTRPVVYGLFADRAALLTALVDRSEQRAMAGLAGVFPALPGEGQDVDPDDLIVTGITAYLSAIRDDPQTWRVILLPSEGAPPELTERVESRRRVLLARLRELTEWGLARRGGPAGLDPDLFARAIFTLAEDAARLMLRDPHRWTVSQFVDFAAAALRGLSRR
jgi:AcrR family transcriptional regulator